MDEYKRLIEELGRLPKGSLSKKKINNKEYYYYQHKEEGKLVSKYLFREEVAEYKVNIKKRQETEKEIKNIEDSVRKLKVPSNNLYELSGNLMMEDTIVASFEKGKLTYIDEKLAPLHILRTKNISEFLAKRAIDRDRKHSRLLKKHLGIYEEDDAKIALYSYGACITDNYWFKAKGSKLKYKDIAFTCDFYSDLALKGDVGFVPRTPRFSPQLTLNGSYEKCWKLIDGEWWLYKNENNEEIFSEILSSRIAKLLEVPTAYYDVDEGFIRTKNFADSVNLEPVSSVAGDDDRYENVFTSLMKIREDLERDYIKLIIFDCIVNNVDRHNENCGILRSRKTGEIISLAPNYDNNLSVSSATQNLVFNAKMDGHAKMLLRFLESNKDANRIVKTISIPKLTKEMIEKEAETIPIKSKSTDLALQYIYDRYLYIKAFLEKQK